jgi:hypothetical protein
VALVASPPSSDARLAAADVDGVEAVTSERDGRNPKAKNNLVMTTA